MFFVCFVHMTCSNLLVNSLQHVIGRPCLSFASDIEHIAASHTLACLVDSLDLDSFNC